MKKLIFLSVFFILSLITFAQKEDTYHDTIIEISKPCTFDIVVIGYIPTHAYDSVDVEKNYQEFSEVVLFVYSLGINIVDVCKEDGLVMMELNEKWNNKHMIIDEINKRYTGTCYYKIHNDSFYRSSCEEKIDVK